MNYTYIGSEEVNLPTLGVTVKAGQTVSSPIAINHPDFVPETQQPAEQIQAPVQPEQTEQVQEEVTE